MRVATGTEALGFSASPRPRTSVQRSVRVCHPAATPNAVADAEQSTRERRIDPTQGSRPLICACRWTRQAQIIHPTGIPWTSIPLEGLRPLQSRTPWTVALRLHSPARRHRSRRETPDVVGCARRAKPALRALLCRCTACPAALDRAGRPPETPGVSRRFRSARRASGNDERCVGAALVLLRLGATCSASVRQGRAWARAHVASSSSPARAATGRDLHGRDLGRVHAPLRWAAASRR